jgi:hypothetical protein
MIKSRYDNVPATPLGVFTYGGTETKYMPAYTNGRIVVTQGNYRWQNPTGRCGGQFLLRGFDHQYGTTGVSLQVSGLAAYYKGLIAASVPSRNMPSVVPTGATRGAEAYDRMKPTAPDISSLNSLVELREVPGLVRDAFSGMLKNFPELKKITVSEIYRALKSPGELRTAGKAVGGLHLSTVFGIIPIIRDVQYLVNSQKLGQERLAQLIRDNGRSIYRRRVIAEEVVTSEATGYGPSVFYPSNLQGFYADTPTCVDHWTESDKIWSCARFRYFLPPGPRDINWTNNMLARIRGQHVTLSTVYNAVPWSWMVDWFTGLGHLVENLNPGVADRCAAEYFYVMRSTETLVRRTSTGKFDTGGGTTTVSCTSTGRHFTKSRLPGDPFGWGTLDTSLSATQWGILGALGLSSL